MVDDTEEQPTAVKGAPTPADATEVSDQGPPLIDVVAPLLEVVDFANRYVPERELGRGGMGNVDLCHDTQIGRRVAMKTIRKEHRDSDAIAARFVREGRVQAQLEHPSIVPVYEFSRDPSRNFYFTMKRVRGSTLRSVLDRLRERDTAVSEIYTRRRLLSDLSRVCLAIDFAHESGVIHRDLKPGNIMFGEYGEVYVLDWGVAKTPEERGSPVTTRTGRVLGTPGYMSPEQIRSSATVQPATDIYALGCILFEILTQRRAHRGSRAEEVIESTLQGRVPTPSEVAPREEIAPELDVICMRATALNPDNRYRSARELHNALEQYLEGERDGALRRSLAETHAEHAREALAQLSTGTGDSEETRRAALREVGRALALDPANRSAMEAMVELLSQPPEEMPPEVEARLDLRQENRYKTAGRIAAGMYFSMMLYFPLCWWAGILDATPIAMFFGCSGLAGLLSLYTSTTDRPRRVFVLLAMFTSCAGISAVAALFGPLVLMPAVLGINISAYAATVDRLGRRLAYAVSTVAIAVPIVLELTGVVGPSLALGPDGMTILPRALGLDSMSAVAVLALASLGTVFAGIVAVGRLRDALTRAESQLEMYNWHFRQLLPDPDTQVSTQLS